MAVFLHAGQFKCSYIFFSHALIRPALCRGIEVLSVRFWPVADAQYRRILHANAILQRIKAVEVCGIKTRQANSKDRRRTPENPKGDLSGRLFPCSPSTGKSEAPHILVILV